MAVSIEDDTIQFTTALSKRRIIEILRKETLYTESIVKPSTPGGKTFFGQVNDDRIRVGNATRYSRNPSPIFELFLSEKENGTEVTIIDDTAEKIHLSNTLSTTMIFLFSGLLLIINTSLAIAHHQYLDILYSLPVLVGLIALKYFNRFLTKNIVYGNRNDDRKMLVELLKTGVIRSRGLF